MNFKATKAEIKKLPESKKELASALFEKCIFQDAELTRLQKIIEENGWTEGYQNGASQMGRKKTGEADSYLSLSKVFNATVKQLNELLAASASADAGDELTDFLKGKKMVSR